MKVYVAGSFGNKENIRRIGMYLRQQLLETYVFCDEDEIACKLSDELRVLYDLQLLTAKSIYDTKILASIGLENLAMLTQCDALVLVLPSGRSAHLEAGWMIGRQRPVYIIGPKVYGEFDAMYVMANHVFFNDQLEDMARMIIRDGLLRDEL